MVPAVVNGFPLLFPDTAAYLNVVFGHSWTLDRSGFYGLLLKPASLVDPATGLWIAVVVQVVTIAGVLVMAARALAPAATGSANLRLRLPGKRFNIASLACGATDAGLPHRPDDSGSLARCVAAGRRARGRRCCGCSPQ